jgi:membrane protein DedA with SNARE-associated domain
VSLIAIATVAVVAAILGDNVGFWVGRRAGHWFLDLSVFQRRRPDLDHGLQVVHDHGGRAVFLARFTAFLRPIVPGLAGTAGMPYRRFLVFNAAGGLVWAGGLTLLGFAAGASYTQVESAVGTASKVALVVVATAVLVLLLWRRRRLRPIRRVPRST